MKMVLNSKNALLLALVFLTPLLFLGFFNSPSADDYSYANMAIEKGFWGAQSEWYQVWSGRFLASAILSVSPVVYHWFLGYKFIGILTYLSFMLCSYVFIAALLKELFSKTQVRMGYLIFSILFLCEMPSITEAFHWFPGVVNYTLALMIFLLGCGYYVNSTGLSLAKGKSPDFTRHALRDALVLSLVSLTLPGINESLVVVWLYLIVAIAALVYLAQKKVLWHLVLPVLAGLASFYIVYKAPGNAVRASFFPHKNDVLFTLFRPLGLEIELFFRYLKPSVFFYLLLSIPFTLALRNKIRPEIYSKKFRWLTLFAYVSIMFLFLAPAHWAMGGAPARRAMNLYCYIHIVLLILMWSQWIWARSEKFIGFQAKLDRYYPRKIQGVVFIISLFAISNLGQAWMDLLHRAGTYSSEQQTRIELLQTSSGQDVVLKPLTYQPETLFFSDVMEDSNDWINKAIATYFGVKSVTLGK